MDITLYRYKTSGSNWSSNTLREELLKSLVDEMNALKFQGEDDERKYGLAKCALYEDIIYGLFIQKHLVTVTDYDSETKQPKTDETPDSGEYLFILFPNEHQAYLQVKRDSSLPNHETIKRRAKDLLRLSFGKVGLGFKDLEDTRDEVDRDKVTRLFYEEADRVIELEATEFDKDLIHELKEKRGGKRQTYFNPREEYQEAMEEGGIKFAEHTQKATIKAKEDEDLKKDPITRAILEGSRKPTRITYIKDNTQKTESSVTKRKEVIHIDGNVNKITRESIAKILEQIQNPQLKIEISKDEDQDRLL